MAKIRCIIKRPEETYGHVTAISMSPKNIQKTIEGDETRTVIMTERDDKPGIVVVHNSESTTPSFRIEHGHKLVTVKGDSIIIGFKDGELCDLPITFETWKRIMFEWGNL